MAAEPHVELRDVHMAFDERVVFERLTCAFPRGKISVILGGSGSGKSTILRLIGGLVHPLSGRIVVAGRDVTQLGERELFEVRKKLGMLFQAGALLDSMTVFDNLAFPLREHTRLSRTEITRIVHERLAAVGLKDVDELLPGQLSGGMLKRAGLARAIVMEPEILLCDEPFSGLDPVSVRTIETLLQEINERSGITMLVVSHHIASTMRFADHVVLLLPDGPVEGAPDDLRGSGDPRVVAFLHEEAPPPPDHRAPSGAASVPPR
jgi:phospholipid/cholesterol/gamma-HCH transport system ATP-binding protein